MIFMCDEHDLPINRDGTCLKCKDYQGNSFILDTQSVYLMEETKHDYPPVWDETLKSWINRPPFAKPGQGAKI